MSTRRNAEIARWLLESRTDTVQASIITGLPVRELELLASAAEKNFRRVLLPTDVTIAVAALAAVKGKIKVVQVGANDGKTGDPVFGVIQRYAQTALLIEPQSALIDRLRANYADFQGQAIIERSAVGPNRGELTLHCVAPAYHEAYWSKVGRDPTQIASVNRAQVLRRVGPRLGLSGADAEEAVITDIVPTVPLSELCARHGLTEIDFLQVDCEGYDMQVLLSLGALRPAVINFESMNLSKEDWALFLSWAKENDYGFIQGAQDTLAIRHFDGRHPL